MADFAGQRLREADHAALGSGVVRRRTDAAVLACSTEKLTMNRAVAAVPGRTGDAPGEGRLQIGIDRRAPAAFVKPVVRLRRPQTCAIHEPAHGAKFGLNRLQENDEGIAIRGIEVALDRSHTIPPQLGAERVEFGAFEVGQREPGARGG